MNPVTIVCLIIIALCSVGIVISTIHYHKVKKESDKLLEEIFNEFKDFEDDLK